MKLLPALRGAVAVIVFMLGAFPCRAMPAEAPPVETLHRFETVGDLRLARCMNGKGGPAACYDAATERGVDLGGPLASFTLALLLLGLLAAWTRRHERWKLQAPRFACPHESRSLSVVQPGVHSSSNRAAQIDDDERQRLAGQMVA